MLIEDDGEKSLVSSGTGHGTSGLVVHGDGDGLEGIVSRLDT